MILRRLLDVVNSSYALSSGIRAPSIMRLMSPTTSSRASSRRTSSDRASRTDAPHTVSRSSRAGRSGDWSWCRARCRCGGPRWPAGLLSSSLHGQRLLADVITAQDRLDFLQGALGCVVDLPEVAHLREGICDQIFQRFASRAIWATGRFDWERLPGHEIVGLGQHGLRAAASAVRAAPDSPRPDHGGYVWWTAGSVPSFLVLRYLSVFR